MGKLKTKTCKNCGKPFFSEDNDDTLCEECFARMIELYHAEPITETIQ
jgi:uncharacterized OB-fold protein